MDKDSAAGIELGRSFQQEEHFMLKSVKVIFHWHLYCLCRFLGGHPHHDPASVRWVGVFQHRTDQQQRPGFLHHSREQAAEHRRVSGQNGGQVHLKSTFILHRKACIFISWTIFSVSEGATTHLLTVTWRCCRAARSLSCSASTARLPPACPSWAATLKCEQERLMWSGEGFSLWMYKLYKA